MTTDRPRAEPAGPDSNGPGPERAQEGARRREAEHPQDAEHRQHRQDAEHRREAERAASLPEPPDPEFGPRGYLPQRAAHRARKIVLREQLGLGWVIASVAAGVLLLAAGGWFVRAQLGPPRPPFVQATTMAEVETGTAARVDADGEAVLVVRAGSRVRAFHAPDTAVVYCPTSGHLEGADGTVWALDGGRLSTHGDSLAALPVEIYRDTVYVDPTTILREPAPGDGVATPACDPPPA